MSEAKSNRSAQLSDWRFYNFAQGSKSGAVVVLGFELIAFRSLVLMSRKPQFKYQMSGNFIISLKKKVLHLTFVCQLSGERLVLTKAFTHFALVLWILTLEYASTQKYVNETSFYPQIKTTDDKKRYMILKWMISLEALSPPTPDDMLSPNVHNWNSLNSKYKEILYLFEVRAQFIVWCKVWIICFLLLLLF